MNFEHEQASSQKQLKKLKGWGDKKKKPLKSAEPKAPGTDKHPDPPRPLPDHRRRKKRTRKLILIGILLNRVISVKLAKDPWVLNGVENFLTASEEWLDLFTEICLHLVYCVHYLLFGCSPLDKNKDWLRSGVVDIHMHPPEVRSIVSWITLDALE